ncbi:P2 gpD-like protein [Shewanella sp. phage 1/41]|uniref:P2 gpD-like protein n=1 Tax=Shewanella sp. phage 1/41 TaxID=1458861 RepID=UPI0004F78676|nr:P2 gpD-like protein [Shewanella sp. phage 1/41]AHK11698.1 P2 gpD-like protein [Shewanella sp. phage 1/41]
MSELDQRIVKVAIIVGDKITWYEGLNIEAKGIKVSNSIMGQCEVVILNISRAAREQILKETNPFLQRGKKISIIVEVGRVSTGTTTLYTGTVFRSQSTPKPNVGVRLTCIQGYDNRSKIVSRSASEITDMSSIAAWVAEDNGYKLSFEIPDKKVARYSFTGSAQASLNQLEALTGADVYVDNKTLYIKEAETPANGLPVRILDKSSGLISAEGTEYGAKMKMLFDNVTKIGGQIDLTSEINPSLNGSYVVRKLPFHITSRDVPFYYIAECNRIDKKR